MTNAQKLEIRASEIREKLNELSGLDELTEEQKTEADGLGKEYRDVETRRRAAIVAEEEEERKAKEEAGVVLDSETREKLELRSKVRVWDFVEAALGGRVLAGEAAEYSASEGAGGQIPVALFESDPREVREAPQRKAFRTEDRAVTSAPGTVGVNMAPIQPAVFAPSIARTMGIDMPMVGSGTFGQARINQSLTAGAHGKGDDATATTATFTISTATPKRVSARLEFLAEDVASAGVANFESALRQNLTMALSAELDDQLINGNGSGNNLEGLFHVLTNPAADGTELTFAHGVGKLANLVDGLWAMNVRNIRQIVGVDTYRKAASLLNPTAGAGVGNRTLADYLNDRSGGFVTNSRMPATASMKQQGLAFRSGRSGMRTAVAPHWGRIGITDVYSGSARAETAVTFHVLIGNVLVIQPGAYAQTEYKVSS